MEKNENQKLQTTGQFNKYHHFLRQTLQFLVSVALLSFLVTYSSISEYFHCFNSDFSTFPFPLLSKTLDRKYMFLICNGIVAVLAKNMGFTTSSPPNCDLDDGFANTNEDDAKPVSESVTESQENASEEEEEEEEEEERGFFNQEDDAKPVSEIIESQENVFAEEEEEEERGFFNQPSSANDEGNEVNVTTEELNKKIEEFIRKMKEEIRIEAQQQLIVV